MIIAVLKETQPGERRVALVPESVKKLSLAGMKLYVEQGAGDQAGYSDQAYADAGATLSNDLPTILATPTSSPRSASAAERDRVVQAGDEAPHIPHADTQPRRHPRPRRQEDHRLLHDAIPRTTRAQAMDTLSSMANITGYKGVLLAAVELPRYFPMFMTAAGTVFPAKVFVIGAGVAGLQAIATAKRLGAHVFATDVRPEVKEQIESVGAKYVGIELQQSAAAGGGYAKELPRKTNIASVSSSKSSAPRLTSSSPPPSSAVSSHPN